MHDKTTDYDSSHTHHIRRIGWTEHHIDPLDLTRTKLVIWDGAAWQDYDSPEGVAVRNSLL
jgi:hypothetical protein